jgi:hypothetical protein
MEIFRVRIDLAVGKNVVGSYNTARIFEFFYLRISVQHNLKEEFSGSTVSKFKRKKLEFYKPEESDYEKFPHLSVNLVSVQKPPPPPQAPQTFFLLLPELLSSFATFNIYHFQSLSVCREEIYQL